LRATAAATHNKFILIMMKTLLWLLLLTGVNGKIKRVKAGQRYTQHDPVHIVVNKVGYVKAT
jgi:hypothetical protein